MPALGEVNVIQGAPPGLARYARGKRTLVKFFLIRPTACTMSSTQSLSITGASLAVNNGTQSFAPFPAYQSFGSGQALTATSVQVNSNTDPVFVVTPDKLTPGDGTSTFTPTFTAFITYSRTDGRTTTFPAPVQYSYSGATFEKKTRALRVLVEFMGDGSPGVLASTQYTEADRQATLSGLGTLSRILAVPGGLDDLSTTTGTGGVRYVINTARIINLKDPSVPSTAYKTVNGVTKFCGAGANWDAIRGLMEADFLAWNQNSANPPVDRMLGVIGEEFSFGYPDGCAEGMSSFVSHTAWVRAISDKAATKTAPFQPSMTGALMAMELQHTWGQVPLPRSTTTHSSNVAADGAEPDHAYNTDQVAQVANDHSAMKFDTTFSPPWNNTNVFDEPADFAYSSCALGGPSPTSFGECTGSETAGTLMGVAAGNGFVVSGQTDGTAAGTTVYWSGEAPASIQLTPGDPDSRYRYVRRRSATDATIDTNFGFVTSSSETSHDDAQGGNDVSVSPIGQFGFALPDDIPPIDSDLAVVQLWKLNANVAPTTPPTTSNATLLYQREQQTSPPQLGAVTTEGVTSEDNYTNDASRNDTHPALSYDKHWVAWQAPLTPGIKSDVIRVGPASSAAASTVVPLPLEGKIVFDSDRTGDLEIYSANVDGTGVTQLTNSPGRDIMPALSPDGSKIAFLSDRNGDDQIYVMNNDGTGVAQLTGVNPGEGTNAFPAWSPTGGRIAFMTTRNGANAREIWTMFPNGSGQTQVTSGGDDFYPSYSPNGQKIAFTRVGGGVSQIFVKNADGTGTAQQLTTGVVDHHQPAWSPQGNLIAFTTGNTGDIFVMHTDGSGQTNLTPSTASDDRVPSWSPDGTKIIFFSSRTGNGDVYRMEADGSSPTAIINNDAGDSPGIWAMSRETGLDDGAPAWRPDGSALAYVHKGRIIIVTVTTAGSTASFGPPTIHFVPGDGDGSDPSYSPDGLKIVFSIDIDGDQNLYVLTPADNSLTPLAGAATADNDESDPSWSKAAGSNKIVYVRTPTSCTGHGCSRLSMLDATAPSTTEDLVANGDQPSFGSDGTIAFRRVESSGESTSERIWSIGQDGHGLRRLTAGPDAQPSLVGGSLAFERAFTFFDGEFQAEQRDVMLSTLLPEQQSTATWTASGPGAENFIAALYYNCNGYAYVVNPSVPASDVSGAVATFQQNFDGSLACGTSGSTLSVIVTNGVDTTVSGPGQDAPVESTPKPPTASILYPTEAQYLVGSPQMFNPFTLVGEGYDADNRVLDPSSLSWSRVSPTGTTTQLGTGSPKQVSAPSGGWPAGTTTFKLIATDGSGTPSAEVSRKVQFVYIMVGGGFLPPVNNPPGTNTGNTGGTFPLKWQLKDANGKFISNLNTVKKVEYQLDGTPPNCDFTAPIGTRQPLPTGGTFLRYDTKNNQFVYNWMLPSTTGCYIFILTLADETEHQAWVIVSK